MKTLQFNYDQLAKFIYNVASKIDHYSFDMFYDISMITRKLNEHRANSKAPYFEEYHLLIRSTGCDLVMPNNALYRSYKERAEKIYSLTFCWNTDYFSNKTNFCEVKEISK